MFKRPDVTAVLLFVSLLLYAASLNVFVIPVVANMVASANGEFSTLSRAALTVGQNSTIAVLVLVALVAGVLKLTKATGDRARQAGVMNLANLVVMVYVAAQAWIFVDMCIQASAIVNPKLRKTAEATLSAPAQWPDVARASAP